MELDHLYRRHHVSLFIADDAASQRTRQVHNERADRSASRIADAKRPALTIAAV